MLQHPQFNPKCIVLPEFNFTEKLTIRLLNSFTFELADPVNEPAIVIAIWNI